MGQLNGQIAIYQTDDGQTRIDVRVEQDTLWLSQAQMADVFGKDSDTIGLHLRNIFDSGELDEGATTEDSSVVRQEGKRQVRRSIRFYNLDAVISVGYRVNSIKGTQFRIWATQRLREHLVQGYTLNQQRLEAQQEKLTELKQAIALSARLIHNKSLSSDASRGILTILEKYSHALTVLDDYDYQRLQVVGTRTQVLPHITYDEAMGQIRLWRERENLGDLFDNEKDDSFKSSLETIYQTFDGKELYPSIEEKAVNLLYFIVKNHSFTDGNSASPPRFLSSLWSVKVSCIRRRVRNASPITRWSRLPCWLPRASRTRGRPWSR